MPQYIVPRTSLLSVVLLAAGVVFASEGPAQRSSENNSRLRQGLKRFPQADANGDGVLTEAEARVFLANRRKGKEKRLPRSYEIQPDHANVKYGPHERNVLDLWLARRDDDRPTPLAIFIHGGGFSGGDKSKISDDAIRKYRAAGISVAAINYRLIDLGPFPMPMQDGAKAIQFLRYHADKYNLNKRRFACFGGSAGGCMSMWLAFHDDLADANSDDPVPRESTRICCAAPSAGQSCLEQAVLLEWFECEKLQEHGSTRRFFGVDSLDELESAEKIALMKEASPIHHLTPDDPPLFASYSQPDSPVDETTPPGTWVHHPRLGIKLKERMDRLGLECHVTYKGGPPSGKYPNSTAFMIDKLNR